ncbi:hypothetical protein [Chryseobacterium sp. Leaf394]|uniref:hypothetical protein n=1 Tax=Chryseobacterium sp. Leaf394 TaxID=1736361 RepID=UPI0006F2A3B8|nr:hypothetical protein [Chryseobacterium sp. Leaf394]KQS92945.1 hypothetical protein ASG21_11060 [Chryseobacterium sp. Leaf394]
MYYKSIILSLGFLSLINCKTQKVKNDDIKVQVAENGDVKTTTKEGEIIYFKEGENKFLKDYQMNVTFKGISEDSRCPKDVQCIWSGVAVAQVEVISTTSRPMTLQISSIENKGRNYHKSADFNGYTISLADISPYPESSNSKSMKGNYKIGIIIIKAGEYTTTR